MSKSAWLRRFRSLARDCGSIIIIVVGLVMRLLAQAPGGRIDNDRAKFAAHGAGGAQILPFAHYQHARPAFRLQLAADLFFAHGLITRDEDARCAVLDLRDEAGGASRADEK